MAVRLPGQALVRLARAESARARILLARTHERDALLQASRSPARTAAALASWDTEMRQLDAAIEDMRRAKARSEYQSTAEETAGDIAAYRRAFEAVRPQLAAGSAGPDAAALAELDRQARRLSEETWASCGDCHRLQAREHAAAELQQTVRVTEERTRAIQEAMVRTCRSNDTIRTQLSDSTEALGRVRDEMGTIVASIQDLAQRNQQIGQIVETVDEVVDQTQVLAINARIEAPRPERSAAVSRWSPRRCARSPNRHVRSPTGSARSSARCGTRPPASGGWWTRARRACRARSSPSSTWFPWWSNSRWTSTSRTARSPTSW